MFGDGVNALIDTIMASTEPVTLICIGPVPNIAAALKQEPAIAERAHFVGMHGSLYLGYGGSTEISAEYNVKADPAACRAAFAAQWDVTITPLDTCGLVQLKGDKYHAVRDCTDHIARAVIENYQIWSQHVTRLNDIDPDNVTSTLFDTVAVYLAFSEDLLHMQTLGVHVTDDGYTVVDENAKVIRCTTGWRDMAAFEDLLVNRLTPT